MAQITTLLPTFQRAHLLEEAINSVREQTYSDWVLYIFDNASNDGTEDCVRALQKEDRRIHYVKRETNVGLFNNFALALGIVQTPFFHFFSDDDLIYPWFYETALQGFKDYPEAGLSACRTLLKNEHNNISPYQFRKKNSIWEGVFPNPEGVKALMRTPYLWTSALFRREILQKVPYLNSRVGIIFDLEFSLRVASHYPIIIRDTPAALFSQWQQGNSSKMMITQPNYLIFIESVLKEIKTDTVDENEITNILTIFKNLCIRNHWIALYLAKEDQKIKESLPYFLEQKYNKMWILELILILNDKLPGSAFVLRFSIQLIKAVRKVFRMPYCFAQRRKTLSLIKSRFLKERTSGLADLQ